MSRVRHEWSLYIASKRDEAGRKVENEVHINRYTERKASTTTIRLRNEAARQAVLGPLTRPCEPGGTNSSRRSSRRSGSCRYPWGPRPAQVLVTQGRGWRPDGSRVANSGGLLSGLTRTPSSGTTAERAKAVLARGRGRALNTRGSVDTRARRRNTGPAPGHRLFVRRESTSALV